MNNLTFDSHRPAVIDLFCGAGGLSLGAARAGFDVVAGVETDVDAIKTHSRNFPNTQHLALDVARLTGSELMKLAGLGKGELIGLIGGPPCQGFSSIGHKNPDDVRNSLFGHFMRLVAETKPAFFIAENVPGIALGKNAKVVKAALEKIPSQYTILAPIQIEGHHYGAPTSRKRLFFIGIDKKRARVPTANDFLPQGCRLVTVKEALMGLSQVVNPPSATPQGRWKKVRPLPTGAFFDRVQATIPPGVGDEATIRRYVRKRETGGHIGVVHAQDVSQRYGALLPGKKDPISRSVRLKLDGFCPTLRAGTGPEGGRRQAVRPIHPTQARVITPREAARLQGFPDWFLLPPTKWHSFRQIGNSVSPIVAEAVLKVLYNCVLAESENSIGKTSKTERLAA